MGLILISASCFAQADKKGTIKVKKPETTMIAKDTAVSSIYGYNQIVIPNVNEVFVSVEEMPEFVGGEVAMQKFIQNNLKSPAARPGYPTRGKVSISFMVNIDGAITDVSLLGGLYGCPACNAEAIRVIKLMPKWKPGKQNGRIVPVQFNLPISFTLK